MQIRSELLFGIVLLAAEIGRLDTPALAGLLDIPPGRTRQAHQAAMAQCDLAIRFRQEGHKTAEDFHQFSAYILESWAALSLRDALDSEPSRSVLYRSAATLAMDCGLIKEAFDLAQRGLQGRPPVDIAHELRQILDVCAAIDASKVEQRDVCAVLKADKVEPDEVAVSEMKAEQGR